MDKQQWWVNRIIKKLLKENFSIIYYSMDIPQ